MNDATATEGDDATINFVVRLDPASTETVAVDYQTSDGSAKAGENYTAQSGTLTFIPGETSKTVAVPILDNSVEENDETLTLSNAANVEIKDTAATGTIEEETPTPEPLTASFKNVPAEHDGSSEFTIQVEFCENIGISYAVLRGDGFTETNGEVTGAARVNGRNDLWKITVKPDGRNDVTITLPGNRDCGTAGVVCTRGDNPRQPDQQPVGNDRRAAHRAADRELLEHAQRTRRKLVHLPARVQRERPGRVQAHRGRRILGRRAVRSTAPRGRPRAATRTGTCG